MEQAAQLARGHRTLGPKRQLLTRAETLGAGFLKVRQRLPPEPLQERSLPREREAKLVAVEH